MPKDLTISTLFTKVDVVANAPSTYEESDALLGEVGGTLEEWIAYVAPRNFLMRLYRDVSKSLAETGYPRESAKRDDGTEITTKKGDGTTVPVLESHLQHINRVHEAGDEALKTTIAEKLQSTSRSLPFWAEGERSGGGGGKVPQDLIDSANAMVADGTAEANVTAIESYIPGFKAGRDSDGQLTPESVSRALHRLEKTLREEEKKKSKDKMAELLKKAA